MFAEISEILRAEHPDQEKIAKIKELVAKAPKSTEILLKKGKSFDSDVQVSLLHEACVNCGVEVIKYLLTTAR